MDVEERVRLLRATGLDIGIAGRTEEVLDGRVRVFEAHLCRRGQRYGSQVKFSCDEDAWVVSQRLHLCIDELIKEAGVS